jgi:phospholipid/cholesterol/gamma-HCH transport system ATP-binding protein
VTAAQPPAAELIGARLSFGGPAVLDGLSLEVAPAAKLSLVGESSCGKTTILKVLAALTPPDEGSVRLFGQDPASLGRGDLDRLRRRVGMQFQAGALFDSMTVGENLLLASQECGRGRDLPPIGRAEIADRLEQVGLGHAARLRPSELSGGMRKRAALARALVADPELAIFDEPTAGLDPITASLIINLLNSLAERGRAAMVLATTDVDVARRFSDDLVLIRLGRVQARGSWSEFASSSDPYVVRYLSRHRLAAPAS